MCIHLCAITYSCAHVDKIVFVCINLCALRTLCMRVGLLACMFVPLHASIHCSAYACISVHLEVVHLCLCAYPMCVQNLLVRVMCVVLVLCVCIHLCAFVYNYASVHTLMRVPIHLWALRTFLCTCVHLRASAYSCLHGDTLLLLACSFMHVHKLYICVCLHTFLCEFIKMCVRVQKCVPEYKCVHLHTVVYVGLQLCTCRHTHNCAR